MARNKYTPPPQEAEPVIEQPPPTPPIAPKPAAKSPVKKAPEPRLTFDMYCSLRGIPVMNRAGMRAFTKLTSATVQEWDAAFTAY